MFEKLLKLSIVDALDRVWSEAGITPSKKTRRAIITAAEKISNSVQEDFIHENKQKELHKQAWESAFVGTPRKNTQLVPAAEETDPISTAWT